MPIIGSEMPPEEYYRMRTNLTPDMLNQCKDYDDCGCVVGRVALASIEGEVLMFVYSSCDAQAPWSRNVELRDNFSYKDRGATHSHHCAKLLHSFTHAMPNP